MSNTDTKRFLSGARIELVELGKDALTDEQGIAELAAAPGTYTVKVSYLGLDEQSSKVTLEENRPASLFFELSAQIYQLKAFTVTGEREGNAAAITSQRNAANVKTVVSMDAFGDLANQNPGELLIRLPGVTPVLAGEGEVFTVNVRGIAPALNTVTIDGAKAASNAPLGREFRFATMPAGLFDELEVIKAPTPDMNADSLGGTVNMKTKSALNLKDKRIVSYRVAGKWAAPFLNFSPRRQEDRLSPQLAVGYKELFDAFGGTRNLGVALDVSHVLNILYYTRANIDYQYTLTDPAYMYSYSTQDNISYSRRSAVSARVDYKFSPNARMFVSGMLNQQLEFMNPDMANFQTNATTGRTISALNSSGQPTGTGAILPGFTDDFTSVRAVSSSTFKITQGAIGFLDKQRRIQFGFDHEFGPWKMDYGAAYSQSRVFLDGGKSDNEVYAGLQLEATANTIGWTLDKSQSSEFPTFTQTAGSSLASASSYKTVLATKLYGKRNSSIGSASWNLKRKFDWRSPIELSTGLRFQRQEIGETGGRSQWSYTGNDLAGYVDPNFRRDTRFNDGTMPAFDLRAIGNALLSDSTAWTENVYYHLQQDKIGTRNVEEEISAAYVMGETKLGRASLLAGVRVEKTDVEGTGFVQKGTYSSITDPYQRISQEYGDPRTIEGSYDNVFPGVHLKYNLTRRLLVRGSWSTSVGRPALSNLVPLATANLTNETLTINNPSVLPQYANNYDLSLEYYFEPVGFFGIGVFRKDIDDFIFTETGGTVPYGADNGYDGSYEGYTIIRQANGGGAKVDGIELAYQQQLSFLPGFLKGFSVYANFTYLKSTGDYGDGINRSSGEIAGFIPKTGNVGLKYNYKRFGFRTSANYVSDYLSGYATDASRRLFIRERTILNVGFTWRLKPWLEAFIDANNLLDAPQEYYRGKESRPSTTIYGGPNVNFGFSGRF